MSRFIHLFLIIWLHAYWLTKKTVFIQHQEIMLFIWRGGLVKSRSITITWNITGLNEFSLTISSDMRKMWDQVGRQRQWFTVSAWSFPTFRCNEMKTHQPFSWLPFLNYLMVLQMNNILGPVAKYRISPPCHSCLFGFLLGAWVFLIDMHSKPRCRLMIAQD